MRDCISRQAVIDLMMQKWGENFSGDDAMQESIDAIREMPSVTPQEPCDKCEVGNPCLYCKHKFEPTTKNDLGVDAVSRQAVLNTLDNMDSALNEDRTVETYKELLKECYKVLPSVTPQEPMVEIDLYSVIKQKYIEREVLDKIRAEIDNALSDGMIHKKTVLGIIDKYKAETED